MLLPRWERRATLGTVVQLPLHLEGQVKTNDEGKQRGGRTSEPCCTGGTGLGLHQQGAGEKDHLPANVSRPAKKDVSLDQKLHHDVTGLQLAC